MKFVNSRVLNLTRIIAGVCLLLWMVDIAHGQLPPLFRDTARQGTALAKPSDERVIRSRNIIVDVAQLRNRQRRRLNMPVFGGRSLPLNLVSIERQTSGLVWKGRVANQPSSSATFVIVGDAVVGNIFTADGRLYQVRYLGNGVHSLREIDQSKFPNEGEPDRPSAIESGTPSTIAAAALPTCRTDPASEIDVLVVFTATTRIAAGGLNGMQANVLLAIEETNDSYNNSGINQRIRLAHMQEVNYAESGNSQTDRDRLRNPTDGFVDNAHTLRNTFAADAVMLVVENIENCGRAFIMDPVSNAFERFAFGVVERGCATGNFSFGHELGHIMGARHDWDADDENNSPFPFNHGFIRARPSSTTTRAWRTIMAVNGSPNTRRIQFWSNPNVNFPATGGDPTGIATGSEPAHNSRTLNTTAPTVANFRCGLPDKNKIWTTVGSDGKVDENDRAKVFFEQSAVQMGRTILGPVPGGRGRAILAGQTQSAVIRYNITPTDTLFRVSGGLELKLRYLAAGSSAKVLARLITVDLATGAETENLRFDSSAFPASNAYQVRSVNQCGTTVIDAPLDFERNAFYVEVSLTTRAIVAASAAGVRMIKVSKADCE